MWSEFLSDRRHCEFFTSKNRIDLCLLLPFLVHLIIVCTRALFL